MTKSMHKRPVWLFSMDSDHFHAAPTTTGTLKAWYQAYGVYKDSTEIMLEHFKDADAISNWKQEWQDSFIKPCQQAIEEGALPIIGFSFYTWNAAEFLQLVRDIKNELPGVFIIAGGPHVQQAEDYLGHDPIDCIILGEGERTFTELLDTPGNKLHALEISHINGVAYLQDGEIIKTGSRERIRELDTIPSPLDVVPLSNENGQPLYESISYETSRGCPFSCAFCEWGTGAIGTKMIQFSMERLYRDWETIVKAGIKNIWLADSNFGALKEDLEKTQLICDLKHRYQLPQSFATSWSKKHSPRVQEMVLLLHENGLLPHYQLALQTLTPLALELSNRKNMAANKYEPIAREMAAAGVPIAAELIWGLPGDNLQDFESNLDTLLATFPNINIFGYTLLPGTEFYEKRHEYQIQTIPVAGYGKAKGEYVIGCHTFTEEEGIEGYFLITAHILLVHGHLLPLTTRYLALLGTVPVSPLLRHILYALLDIVQPSLDDVDITDKMQVYENRSKIYLALFDEPDKTYAVIRAVIKTRLLEHGADPKLIENLDKLVRLDSMLAPLKGEKTLGNYHINLQASAITHALESMSLPDDTLFSLEEEITVETPGGVGTLLKDPDGGSWMKGRLVSHSGSMAIDIS